jgi:hypothetical protein
MTGGGSGSFAACREICAAVLIARRSCQGVLASIMRPLAFLIGILMGSTVSLAVVLLMVWIVILLLPQQEQRFAPEHAALLQAVLVFTLFSLASAASFYGDLRRRSWRHLAHAATLGMLAVAVFLYWPK